MSISMYSASVPVYVQFLTALAGVLKKAEEHCAAKKIEPSVLVTARLSPDMYALARQVQIASDHAKGSVARLAGVEVPSFADTEATFAELQARIAKTLAYVQGFKPAQIDGSDDKNVVLEMRTSKLELKGADYLTRFALPNFFFHVTTAYDILRHAGVDVGKRDFMGGK